MFFFAIANEIKNEKLEKIEICTEDEAFRILNLNEVYLEIRTFDTSFFEIFSEDEGIIKMLSDKFNCKYESI